MAVVYPSEDTIRRAIKEAIPRDWFGCLDLEMTEATPILIRRVGRRKPVIYNRAAEGITPAVIEALVATKKESLAAILNVQQSRSCATAIDCDLDAIAYQFFGDLYARYPDESDDSFRARLKCIFSTTDATTGEELKFLGNPTAVGIRNLLECHKINVYIPSTTSGNVINTGWYWWKQGTKVDVNRPPARGWNGKSWNGVSNEQATTTMGWNGSCVTYYIEDQGEIINERARYLVNHSRALGVCFNAIIVDTGSGLF